MLLSHGTIQRLESKEEIYRCGVVAHPTEAHCQFNFSHVEISKSNLKASVMHPRAPSIPRDSPQLADQNGESIGWIPKVTLTRFPP